MTKNYLIDDNEWRFLYLNNDNEKIGRDTQKINLIIANIPYDIRSENHADKIINLLWLGNYSAASDPYFIKREKIRYVINATTDIPNYFENIYNIRIPIHDKYACYTDLMNYIEYGADMINQAITQNQSILVHCKRGHHRSASIVACYLMKFHNMSLGDAIYLIKQIRPTTFTKMTCILKTLICYQNLKLIN